MLSCSYSIYSYGRRLFLRLVVLGHLLGALSAMTTGVRTGVGIGSPLPAEYGLVVAAFLLFAAALMRLLLAISFNGEWLTVELPLETWRLSATDVRWVKGRLHIRDDGSSSGWLLVRITGSLLGLPFFAIAPCCLRLRVSLKPQEAEDLTALLTRVAEGDRLCPQKRDRE